MQRELKIILIRDRIGIKPLYWAKSDGLISFASEIKAILTVTNAAPKINEEQFSIIYHSYQYRRPILFLMVFSKGNGCD